MPRARRGAFAGRTAIAAAAAEGLIALSAVAGFVAEPLFAAMLLVLVVYFLVTAISRLHVVSRLARSVLEITAVMFLTAQLLIPYSIHLSGWFATSAVSSLSDESRGKLVTLHQEITGSTSSTSFDGWSKDDEVKSGFERAVSDLPHKVDTVGLYLMRQLASAVLLGVVFPLGLMLLFLGLARRLIGSVASTLHSDWTPAPSTEPNRNA